GNPVVEPGGGALEPGRHPARGIARRSGGLGLAPGRGLFRSQLAPVRGHGWQPLRAVVAAGGARLGGAAGPGGGVLADAAARGAGHAAVIAAVAAPAAVGPGAAAARRGGTARVRRWPRAVGAGTHPPPQPAVRRR